MKKKVYSILGLVSIFFFFSFSVSAMAASSEKAIRVGWFPFEGYQEYDEDGKPYGYNYEYLQKIAGVTGWKYEFVDVTWGEALEMLQKGDLDIVGCMFKSAEREELYDYPELDVGTTSTAMFVSRNSALSPYDFESFNGLRVGCCFVTNNDEEFLEFADTNGFSVELVDYETEPELIKAVEKGEVDAGVAGSQITKGNIRVVAGFAPAPFFLLPPKEM